MNVVSTLDFAVDLTLINCRSFDVEIKELNINILVFRASSYKNKIAF